MLTSSMSLHVLLHELRQLLTLSHCHSNRCVFSVDTPRGQVVSYLSVMVFCRFGRALRHRHLQKFPIYFVTDKKSILQSDSPRNKVLPSPEPTFSGMCLYYLWGSLLVVCTCTLSFSIAAFKLFCLIVSFVVSLLLSLFFMCFRLLLSRWRLSL